MKKPAAPSRETRWSVYLLRKKAERIGAVHARDADAAKVRAIATYQIEEHDRFRVSVLPERH